MAKVLIELLFICVGQISFDIVDPFPLEVAQFSLSHEPCLSVFIRLGLHYLLCFKLAQARDVLGSTTRRLLLWAQSRLMSNSR